MALKKFIGARYAPEFAGAWSNTKQYAALSVVYADNRSYVSRKTVPAGTAISNTEFWIQSSDWNAQVAEYNLKVEGYNANVEKYNKNVEDYSAAVSGFYADTLHSFDTKADMQADRTLALGETVLTCGDKKIGDGGGSFYQVVAETSVTAVALDNGLFAEPFEFQPYDYSQFQKEVEGYKDSTTRVYNTQQDMVADVGINAGNILMTTGALEQGDGQGSFWNVTDNQEEGSVPLQNGKYAKKFNIASVDVSGNLLFNNKGNQVAIWGIKAGGEAVNVPVSYALGETRTVYVAVEYTPDNTNAKVNLVVSGPTSFTKSFAWSDASVTAGQVKTVMYAITLHSQGNNVYTGSQTVTSYLTTLERFVETFTVYIPDASGATSAWDGPNVNTYKMTFTCNSTAVLSSIGFATAAQNFLTSSIDFESADKTVNYSAANKLRNVSSFNSEPIHVVLYPNTTYTLSIGVFNLFGSPTVTSPKNKVTGNYGIFTFNNQAFAGRIRYTGESVGEVKTANIPDTSNPIWSAASTTTNYAPFTVTKPTLIKSFTINTDNTSASANTLCYITVGTSNTASYLFQYSGKTNKGKIDCNVVLYPGTTYALAFSNISAIAQPVTGTFGNFVFNDSNYSGTIEYCDIE